MECHQRIDGFDHEKEDDQCDDKKCNDRVDEGTNLQLTAAVANSINQARETIFAPCRNEWGDDIADKSSDHASKCRTDDDTDSEVYDVAA